jgi:hypothetical protein
MLEKLKGELDQLAYVVKKDHDGLNLETYQKLE